jgi:uncharacterized cupredoxin-like copper-binding protein
VFKTCAAVVGALAGIAAVAAVATAQQPVPTVAVTASPTAVAVQPAGPLAAGPTHFQINRAQNRNGLSVYFALLVPGVSLQDLQAALLRDDRTRGSQSLGMVSIQSSVAFSGTETRKDVTFTLKPGLSYVMVTEPDAQNDRPPASRGFGTFATGAQASGATAPQPNATVRMVDLRFRGSATLPRRGVVRVENFGAGPHIAIAFPLRSSVTSAQFGRALRSNSEQAIGRLVAGQPVALQNVLSGGGTSNDQTVSFARSGKYGLVCFVNEHNRLGMYRLVNVR